VRADLLRVHTAEEDSYGIAEGNVRVDDPDGQMTATRLTFNWKLRTGIAENIRLESGNVIITAKQIDIQPEKWVATDAYATPCRNKTPLFHVTTPRVELQPGRKAVVRRPTLSVLGRKVLAIGTQTYSLDPKADGIPLPRPSLRSGFRPGITWNPQLLFDDRTGFSAGLNIFQRSLPTYDFMVTHSFIKPGDAIGSFMPSSDFDERFREGYFDRILVDDPDQEARILGRTRSSVSVGTRWNQGMSARQTGGRFSKAVELVVENGRNVGGMGVKTQVRYEQIRRGGDPFFGRGSLMATGLLPSVDLSKHLSTYGRGDLGTYVSSENRFTWARGAAGLVLQPDRHYRIGASYTFGSEAGTSDFRSDRLVMPNGLHVRGDLSLGPTQLSAIFKFDRDRRKWSENEWSISQVVGCLEPFVLYRSFPRTLGFGVRLRIDEFLDRIEQRSQRRTISPESGQQP
jgi:hypothetical protein